MSRLPVVIIGSGLAGYTVAREFRKLDGEGPLRASFVVFVYPKPLPDFTEKGKPQLISAASDGLSAVYEGHRQETVQDATVDNLKALRLTGLLSRKAAPVPPPAPSTVRLM